MFGLTALIGVAIAGSILWLGGAAFYVDARIGWDNLFALYPTELATLSAAAFTPVAGLWLMIAFLSNSMGMNQQAKSIRQFLWQARRSAEHTEVIARMMVEMQHQTKHAGFFNSLGLSLAELNGLIAGMAQRYGLIAEPDLANMWHRSGQGDTGVFARLLVDTAHADPEFPEKFGRRADADGALRGQVSAFFRRYNRLLVLAKEHDGDKLVVDVIQEGELGQLRNMLAQVSQFRAEASLADSTNGATLSPALDPMDELEPTSDISQALDDGAAQVIEGSQPAQKDPVKADAPSVEPRPIVEAEPPSQEDSAQEKPAPAPDKAAKPAAAKAPEAAPARRKKPELVSARVESGQPFSPLSPGFPKADSWPEDAELEGKKAP